MSTINAKFIHLKLKNQHWTVKDFANHFELSEDDFKEALEVFDRDDRNSMLRDMKKNEKLRRKVGNDNTNTSESVLEVEAIPKEDASVPPDSVSDENPISDETPNNFSESNLLEDLRKTEERLVVIVCQEEARHQKLISARHDIAKRAEAKKAELLRLQNIIKKYSNEVSEMSKKFLEISAQIQTVNLQLSEHQAQLAEIRENIKILEKPVIYVYDNGEIETENSETIIPENWTDVFGELVNHETAELLTIRQVKQLAKVISFTRFLSEQSLEYDIEFENELVQKAFVTIAA